MSNILTVATWNIAEGHLINSAEQFDYIDTPQPDYFANELRKMNPDIICLQESRCNAAGSVAKDIAGQLGFTHTFETPVHTSHIDANYDSSLAILSRRQPDETAEYTQPYPDFPLTLPNGKPASKLNEKLQLARFGTIAIANTKTQPLEFLGTAYETERGRRYAAELSQFYCDTLHAPLILAGDFNTPYPSDIFSPMLRRLQLTDVLPQVPTKPSYHGHLDCIFTSGEFEVVTSEIVPGKCDHFLGYVALKY